jgi:hypothetical protein
MGSARNAVKFFHRTVANGYCNATIRAYFSGTSRPLSPLGALLGR